MVPILLFFLFVLSHLVLLCPAHDEQYQQRCPPFQCGDSHDIQFPYRNGSNPECGLYPVNCTGQIQKVQLKEGGHWYGFKSISPRGELINIYDTELNKYLHLGNCESIKSFSFPIPSVLSNVSTPNSLTLYNCSHTLHFTHHREFNYTPCGDYRIYYPLSVPIDFPRFPRFPPKCSRIQLPPAATDQNHNHTFKFLSEFTLEVVFRWKCRHCYSRRGGQCRLDSENKFHCSVARKGNKNGKLKLGLGLGLGLGIPLLSFCLWLIWRRYKQKHASSDFVSRNISDPRLNPDPEGGSAYFGVPLFSYKELEEATHNFDDEKELGDGGFGTVYHGKLKDGREVAVKRLYEHNYKRVEQFMNEIEILTRLQHKNLVSLYGCTSRQSRELLLVYEYIPNGTVADHLHGDRAKTAPLSWPIRMSIAIETANALVYLHATEIVHRDVKTNNILLDENFCVKVADFGLSRLFPTDVTHVSTAPQGTPGYVDPEYHQCYQLTSKSDVYSFGVVLVELLSSMPAVDITRHRHEINLSNLAISKIQKCAYHELIDPLLGFNSEIEVKRMTIAVAELAFQCLQQDKEMRPSMEEVLEELTRIERGENDTADQEKVSDGAGLTVQQSPSANCDEIGLLKNMKQQPPSPIAVTEKWLSSRSSTPNISG
ncbi:hypothetical protein UlMin_040489 [Ulmus minor]